MPLPDIPVSLTKTALAEAIATAIRSERRGRADVSEAILRGILLADATATEAWLRLGGLALGDGRHRMAARCFARVMVLAPDRAQALHNLGEALRLAGRKRQAAIAFTRALRLRPAYPKALAAFGLLLQDGGSDREARHMVARALVVDPALSGGWHNLATLLRTSNHPHAVARLLRRAVLSDPSKAAAMSAYGLALCACKRSAEAVPVLRHAAAQAPGDPAVLGNLAFGLMQTGDTDAACRLIDRLRRLAPAAPEADAQEALIRLTEGDFARAAAVARRSIALGPAHANALINHALILHSLGMSAASVQWNRRVLRLDGQSMVARFNLSLTLLQRGDFVHGWPLYEARWAIGGAAYPRLAPAWDGSPLNGRSILLVAEQGHGDTLQFVRYASLLAEQGGRVVLLVQPLLKRLLANTPGVEGCYGLDEIPPPCDLCAPMLSVPGLVGTRLPTIPSAIPYLRPDERDRRLWRDRLAGERRLKVGLVWAGEPRRDDFTSNSVDRRRSLTLAALAPLAAVPGVAFYSIQMGEAGAQAKNPPTGMALVDWTAVIVDFADTAALIEQLDLVITVDTSVCHLAGGLGRPVWVLSRHDSCWRWLERREDSPWYPTMSLFHQDEPGAWAAPIARMAAALAELAFGFSMSESGSLSAR